MARITARRVHGWSALVAAPSLLFFALTGIFQIFGFHESHNGYVPVPIIEKLGELHKKQAFRAKPPRPSPPRPAGDNAPQRPPRPASTPVPTLLLRWFFALVSASLVVSTVLGVWIGLTQTRQKKLHYTLLAAGTLVPIILAML
ncbi:MAG: hypothetical protein JJK57_18810 [Komagataeibacter hansenii]|nr:hypothetical protein [Novacetimonas hansenii]